MSKGKNFDSSFKEIKKIHFVDSLHSTKQWQQQSKQKYALHGLSKTYFKTKNKGHSFFIFLCFVISIIPILFSLWTFNPRGKQ